MALRFLTTPPDYSSNQLITPVVGWRVPIIKQKRRNTMNAIQILCDGTTKAAILILESKGIERKSIDAERLSADLRVALKAEIEIAMAEWRKAVDANMNELWLRELMNTQCNHIALHALKAGEWF